MKLAFKQQRGFRNLFYAVSLILQFLMLEKRYKKSKHNIYETISNNNS